MKEEQYRKGNNMVYPFEEENEECIFENMKYLYPTEVKQLQQAVEDVCDQMEYDGSIMYDERPDKICIEAISKRICNQNCVEKDREEKEAKWLRPLVQVMICREIAFRQERRRCHKKRMGR